MRLEKGEGRIRLGEREREAQARLGRHGGGRKPDHPQFQEYLRKAGATAREMLIAAAAQQWGVPASECSASNSFIVHGPSKRRLSFGKVADAASKLEPPKDVKLKDPKEWKLIGKSVKRIDIPDTVMGKQRFGIDVQLPGMLYAAIAQCPVFGGKVKSIDAAKVEGRRGIVKVLPMESFVAVVADNWWRAKEALRDVHIEWDIGANGNVSSASLMEFYRGGIDAQSDVATSRKDGDFDQAYASAAKKIEAEYYTPYLAHSCLEPMGCTAIVKDGKVDVWTSTQNAEASLANAAATAGVPLENVEVHRVQLGGGFGRRGGAQDFVRQGVAIAKSMEGTPVKMLWTREEDTQHDFYRPASLIRIKAGSTSRATRSPGTRASPRRRFSRRSPACRSNGRSHRPTASIRRPSLRCTICRTRSRT